MHFALPWKTGALPALVVSALLLVAVTVGGCSISTVTTGTDTSGSGATTHQFGVQTKTSSCQASGGLPDSACTPGAIFADATVSRICTSGYASSVRNVSSSTKDKVYAAYDIASHYAGQYEVDHLVSLELGGSNDISNLWPEAASPTPGFHQKDQVENYLHAQVCNGSVPLAQAQLEIATNWLAVYNEMQAQGLITTSRV